MSDFDLQAAHACYLIVLRGITLFPSTRLHANRLFNINFLIVIATHVLPQNALTILAAVYVVKGLRRMKSLQTLLMSLIRVALKYYRKIMERTVTMAPICLGNVL